MFPPQEPGSKLSSRDIIIHCCSASDAAAEVKKNNKKNSSKSTSVKSKRAEPLFEKALPDVCVKRHTRHIRGYFTSHASFLCCHTPGCHYDCCLVWYKKQRHCKDGSSMGWYCSSDQKFWVPRVGTPL